MEKAMYKVLIKDGLGSTWEHLHEARAVALRDNGIEMQHLAAFKNGEDIFLCTRSARDYFKAVIEAETGTKSQVCTVDKSGAIKVW